MKPQELLSTLNYQNIDEHADENFMENLEAIIQRAEQEGSPKLWLGILAFEYGRICGIREERAKKLQSK